MAHLLAISISAGACDLTTPQLVAAPPVSSCSFFCTGSSLEVVKAAAGAADVLAGWDLLQPVRQHVATNKMIGNKELILRIGVFYSTRGVGGGWPSLSPLPAECMGPSSGVLRFAQDDNFAEER